MSMEITTKWDGPGYYRRVTLSVISGHIVAQLQKICSLDDHETEAHYRKKGWAITRIAREPKIGE